MKSIAEFERHPLSALIEKIDYGLTASALIAGVGPKFLRITDIQNGEVNWETVPSCTATSEETIKHALASGDIVFARTGATTGKSFLIQECPQNALFASYLIRVRPSSRVHPGFLARFFQTPDYWRQIETKSRGAGQPGVNATSLKEIIVPLPSIEEQRHIAKMLDTADAICRKRQEALRVAEDLLRSIFLDMFGDPITNPKGWERKALGSLGVLARGKSKHRPRNDPALLGGPYPLIQTGEVANADTYIRAYSQTYSELGLQQSKMWPQGTLCITIAANIADTAILGFDACFPDSVVGFTPGKEATTEYIHFWLRSYQRILQERAPESAQKNINLEILDGLKVGCPPIGEQKNFVRAFNKVETLKRLLRESVTAADNLFLSLQQRAFRGELKSHRSISHV